MDSAPESQGINYRRWIALVGLIVLLMMAAAGWAAGVLAQRQAVDSATSLMANDARLRAALLNSEVARFRLLPLALTGDAQIAGALSAGRDDGDGLSRKLEQLARETGAAVIYVLDEKGITLASSNWRTPSSFIGQNYGFRSYFREAQRDGSGMQFALGTVSGQPGLYLARRTTGSGVIVVKLEFSRIERQWASAGGLTLVENRDGIVLITSRPDLRFAATHELRPAEASSIRDELRVSGSLPKWDVPRGWLSVTVPTDIGDWKLLLIAPLRDVAGQGVLIARLAAAGTVLGLAALGFAFWVRAKRRRQLRALERARTIELENAIAASTADLRREMEERQASEARAAALREGLRQANRLATLGQVTASVAHETAQPVTAIRNYASNGERLLDMGDTQSVRDNLRTIAKLAERIGVVTQELRGFARKGSKPLAPIALGEVVGGALLILKERLRGVTMDVAEIKSDIRVLAGRIRLEQVLVNLLQNAAEAVEGVRNPTIVLTVLPESEKVMVRISDNGPGVAPELADRLFTPFATSRENGLGLGLVIAQDIAHDLGGTLRLVDGGKGACFELTLMRAP